MAVKTDRRFCRAYLSWIVAVLGARPYSWHVKAWRASYSSLRKVKLRLKAKIRRGAMRKLVETEM